MNLSPKAMRAIAEALEFRIAAYQSQLDSEELSEDKVSDLTNDSMFLESLLQEMRTALALPVAPVF
ncbi:MAG: hypothetical protein LH613_11425 [Chamaesiphon sp.]|nr:hypothetical protein [Chamaesiphon sp.]